MCQRAVERKMQNHDQKNYLPIKHCFQRPSNNISLIEWSGFDWRMAWALCSLWKFITTSYQENQLFQCNGDCSPTNQMPVSHTYFTLLNTIMNYSACLYSSVMKKNLDQTWFFYLRIKCPSSSTPSNKVFYTSFSWFLKGHSYVLLHLFWIKVKGKTVRRAFIPRDQTVARNYSECTLSFVFSVPGVAVK